jgi:predicted ATPase/DNA-binding CsgD family transcriptional regulator/DNA-binding XRE family transcriptional regulator
MAGPIGDTTSYSNEPLTPIHLARRRRALGLSQQELGNVLGVPRNTVARWERGDVRIARPEWLTMALARLESHKRQDSGESLERGSGRRSYALRLPAELSRFVGRESEIDECTRLLHTERLITLSGFGGIGKSRLAAQVARRVAAEFADGVFYVELQALERPPLARRAVAEALGIIEHAGDSLLELVTEKLQPLNLLLVLDDCDHVVADIARFAYHLLRACPNLVIVTTCREPLEVQGEVAWRVPPLRVPHSDAFFQEIASSDAVRLFVQRAHAVAPWFNLSEANAAKVADLCRRLDGIPLALELAAARMKILSVDRLLARLESGVEFLDAGSRTAPDRQQTLKATVDFSYRMLTEPERVLFRRLSVFAGGWTLEAAERVADGEPLASSDVLRLLERLFDRSMVVSEAVGGGVRQHLPHTLREYARERLIESGEEAQTQRRHFDWQLNSVQSINPDTLSPREIATRRLELDNLRTAWGWAIDAAETELALRLAAAAIRIWNYRGDLAEGVGWVRRTLGLPGVADFPVLHRQALKGLGSLNFSLGDMAAARAALDEGCGLLEHAQVELDIPVCSHLRADVARATGDLAGALRLYRRAEAEYHELGASFGVEAALALMASVLFEQGEYAASRDACDRCLALGRGRTFTWATSRAEVMLAYLACQAGDEAEAVRLAHEALTEFRAITDPSGIAFALRALSHFALERGSLCEAPDCLTEALEIACDEGDNMGLARTLEAVACILAAGSPAAAAQIAGAASQLRTRTGTVLWPSEQARVGRCLDVARQTIGADGFGAAWTIGERLTRSQATDLARQSLETLSATDGPCSPPGDEPLTARQREIVALVAHGLTNAQIAEQLVISPATARAHVEHILNRLKLHSRTQIAAWAAAHGLAPAANSHATCDAKCGFTPLATASGG